MSETVALSFRTSPDKAERLEELARATDRPRSWILEQALEAYLDTQAWQVAHIEKSLARLKAGEGVPHEKVEAWLRSWGTDEELEPPR